MASRISPSFSLTEKAMNTISDHILDLTLAPGIHPVEKLMIERFKLSRPQPLTSTSGGIRPPSKEGRKSKN
jgi:hypothetical protein